ncbi:MAG TPA: Holliday junction branch migration protein RuvA [Vicinamibacterales bacterium]|nr:Holliday junction branch migration protein RuvA [Vicinamibacterales bacterium]
MAGLPAVIAVLRGTLLEKSPSRIVVDVAGVGYDVQVPLSTFYGLGEPGTSVSLRIHTHVREDAIALYGFGSVLERELFDRLIAIGGVGPKLALAVLSGIEPAELVKAVRLQDVARLTAIPGVGKKTAERIGLELKDRLPAAAQAVGQEPPAAASPRDRLRDDLLSALLNLGYQRAAADKAIEKVVTAPGARFEDSLKAVLKSLMRS